MPHHSATALATSARKQSPDYLDRTRVVLLSSSLSCCWLLLHWAKAAEYLERIPTPQAMRASVASSASPSSLSSSDHGEAQVALVRQTCWRATHRGSDVRPDANRLMRPDAWPRQPTDPSRWTWRPTRKWKWKQSSHITELEVRSAIAAIRWRARSSSLLRELVVLFIDNQSFLAVLVKSRSSSRALNAVGRQVAAILLCSLNRPLYVYTDTDRNPADAGSRKRYATANGSTCTKAASHRR